LILDGQPPADSSKFFRRGHERVNQLISLLVFESTVKLTVAWRTAPDQLITARTGARVSEGAIVEHCLALLDNVRLADKMFRLPRDLTQ
jgi:hypothetical protein